jgi:uncharacterized protein YeeX (DUF496 family)
MNLELKDDLADQVVVSALYKAIKQFEKDLEDYKIGDDFIAIFSTDEKEDKKQIRKHIKAFKKAHNYFCMPGEQI